MLRHFAFSGRDSESSSVRALVCLLLQQIEISHERSEVILGNLVDFGDFISIARALLTLVALTPRWVLPPGTHAIFWGIRAQTPRADG